MATDEELRELAAHLHGAMPDLTPDEQRLALSLYRSLAEGRPVGRSQLAHRAGLSELQVDQALNRWPGVFTDELGRIIGFWGLALAHMPHQFDVDGRELFTWCAWDALFIPPLLGRSARVTSNCPTTGEPVRLTVTPTGVADAYPPTAVLTFVRPDQAFDENVVMAFCHYVLFFESAESARPWLDEHAGTFMLSLDEGFRLGQLTNRARLSAVLNEQGQTSAV